jgi:hydroxymethylbilane synthase
MSAILRIVTRESPLALWQAGHVRDGLRRAHPGIDIEIVGIKSEADRFLDASLSSLGGKGAFVKELEEALLEHRADLAVHSMKDVPADLHAGLSIAAILPREDPVDVFVSNTSSGFEDLPDGAVIGTASLRRRCQILARRPGVKVAEVRGNVGTRLRKLDEGRYDALMLAKAGLMRLGLGGRIAAELDTQVMLPAIGQGALGVEVRSGDEDTRRLVSVLNDQDTYRCVSAERMVNRRLNGGCHSPIAAYARIKGHTITISALAGSLDGSEIVRAEMEGPAAEAEAVGDRAGSTLLARGAGRILEQLRADGVL